MSTTAEHVGRFKRGRDGYSPGGTTHEPTAYDIEGSAVALFPSKPPARLSTTSSKQRRSTKGSSSKKSEFSAPGVESIVLDTEDSVVMPPTRLSATPSEVPEVRTAKKVRRSVRGRPSTRVSYAGQHGKRNRSADGSGSGSGSASGPSNARNSCGGEGLVKTPKKRK
eukprot:PhM_4_TR553/c0_g1_i1/m.37375